MNRRELWGEFTEKPDEASREELLAVDQEIMMEKRGELKILHSSVFFEPKEKHIKLSSKNQTVNQIVGLKHKQEMIQQLIDSSYSDNFQQLLPTLKESIEVIPTNIPTARHNDKFNKICFIPPHSTAFTTGKPNQSPTKVNKTCVQLALKKAICGLVRLTDYKNISESALTMFADSTDHFFKSLMEAIVTVLNNEDRETETDVDIVTFERGYFALTADSSTVFFNYFKKEIYDKHQQTVAAFTGKVLELKTIVENQQSMMSDLNQPDFYQSFFVKEEIKQEFDDYET